MVRQRFTIRVEDRTELTADENEISMRMNVYAHVVKDFNLDDDKMRDAIIQQFGKRIYGKRLKIGLKGA